MSPFSTNFGYGSTTSADQWHTKRGTIEAFAASDVFAGAAVKFSLASATGASVTPISQPPGFFVQMCGSQNDEPVGFARDNAVAGGAITVIDIGNIIRETVQGSVNLGQYVGVISASPAVHPVSGVTNYVPNLGQVTAASWSNVVNAVGASSATFSAVWTIGTAMDIGNPGQGVAIRVNPRLLSGLG